MKALYKWFAYKLPIRSKLLISFSILVMVPILVLGIYSYQQSKENTERQIRSTMESNLARLTSELDTRFQREGSTVRFLAYNLTFRNALENSGASAMTMAQVMNTSVEPTFWYFIAGDSYVKGMEVYSTKVRDKIGNFLLPVDDTVSQQAWYRQALDSYATHWTYDGVEICANRAILDTNSSSEVIAVLRMFCYPASLLDATDSMNYLDNGRPSMPATAVWMLWTKPCACWPRMAARPPRLSRGCSIKAGWKSAAGAFITIWTKRTSTKNCSRF